MRSEAEIRASISSVEGKIAYMQSGIDTQMHYVYECVGKRLDNPACVVDYVDRDSAMNAIRKDVARIRELNAELDLLRWVLHDTEDEDNG